MDRNCTSCGLSFDSKGGTVPVLLECPRGGDHILVVITPPSVLSGTSTLFL